MKISIKLILITGTFITSSAFAQAPAWSDDQEAVWAVVAQSWEDDASENGNWPGEYASENFVAWAENIPAPRSIETYTAWERSTEEASETFWHEITPLAIAVEGETAVVMYLALIGEEDSAGERSVNSISIVEVLNRDGRNWKYLATANFTADFGN